MGHDMALGKKKSDDEDEVEYSTPYAMRRVVTSGLTMQSKTGSMNDVLNDMAARGYRLVGQSATSDSMNNTKHYLTFYKEQ